MASPPRPDLQSAAALYPLARRLLQEPDYDGTLDAVMEGALGILGGDRGFLVLTDKGALRFQVVRNWSRAELEAGAEPVSRSILARVLSEGEPLLIEDALADPQLSAKDSVLRMGIRSVLAAPLAVEGAVVGALYLESRRVERLFGPAEHRLFLEILELAGRALETATRRSLLERRNALLEKDILARYAFPGIVTGDPGFLRLLETVGQVAASELPVLVQGPSGSGKELVIRALHLNSRRGRRSLVTLNCGAISPALLESELFGHVRGAFTGATRDKAGLISEADGGTFFLDEIGELPLELQAKLLRTLQEGEVQPVGSTRPVTVDVRFLAATNRDLEEEVEGGRFREDLLYRLNAITLDLPALKDRPGDVLLLFHHFLREAAEREGRPVPEVPAAVWESLERYDWPGNIRELKNEALRLLALSPPGLPLAADALSRRITTGARNGDAGPPSLEAQERELIRQHLQRAAGNRTRAARSLGLSREGLRKKMKRLGLG
jgi:Nif-specific regulatory protein/two-component system response regulator HydG